MTDKEVINDFKNIVEESRTEDRTEYYIKLRNTLDVLENQQNRIAELKKIEEAHRELNGELRKELQMKDEILMDIVKRLDNDIKNITATKSEGYTDDYRRCRLKAYKTKTREIKEYIEEKYFTKKESEDNA